MNIKYVSNPEKYKISYPNVEAKQAEIYCNYCHSWADLNNQNCQNILCKCDHLGFIIFPEQYYYDAGFCMRATCNEKRAAKKKRDDDRFYRQEAECIAQEKAAIDKCDKILLIASQTSRKENEDHFPSFTEYKKKKAEEQKRIELESDELYKNRNKF